MKGAGQAGTGGAIAMRSPVSTGDFAMASVAAGVFISMSGTAHRVTPAAADGEGVKGSVTGAFERGKVKFTRGSGFHTGASGALWGDQAGGAKNWPCEGSWAKAAAAIASGTRRKK
jgi:hypothetical protein